MVIFAVGLAGVLISYPGRPPAGIVAQSGSSLVRPSGEQEWRPAGDVQELAQGDVVRTSSDANLLLQLYGKSQISVAPNSEIALLELRPGDGVTIVSQAYGLTQHVVEPLTKPDSRYEVRTPSSVITVVGTTFQIDVAPDGTTTVTTTAGEVHVEAQGTVVQVAAGRSVTVRPGRGPGGLVDVPKPLPTLWFPADLPVAGSAGPPTLAVTPTLRPLPSVTPPAASIPSVPGDTPAPADTEEPKPVKTKQTPPGQTRTPQPPGQTRTPWPPPNQEGVPPGQKPSS
jgi:hypothetical protein